MNDFLNVVRATLELEGLGLFAGFASLSLLSSYIVTQRNKRQIKKSNSQALQRKTDFDVLIVGAGPAGATAAFFAAKAGLKVGLFDKKTFPRYKPCGDAWCAPALDILEEMDVLEDMEKDGIAKAVQRGGFISPFGYECINTDGQSYGSVTGCRTYAMKRELADVYLVRAAAKQGANLHESVEVTTAAFHDDAWTVSTRSESNTIAHYTARVMLICDGSTSYLAQKLGIIPTGSQPEAICSTGYIMKHNWQNADGVMIFNKSVLPGYSALFRHANGDMYVGTYVLPGGKATSRCIAPFENEAMEQHPYIHDALGDDYQWRKKRTVAPIRLGGVDVPYSTQCLLVGDAAGHVDPLTGEGIHTAMVAGKVAAQCVHEMHAQRNFSLEACEAYALRVYDAFVYEFQYSSLAAKAIYHMPILLDAMACVGQRRGQKFLDFFGEVMTGVKPKYMFLTQPDLVLELVCELVYQFVVQYVLFFQPLVPYHIGQEAVDLYADKKQGSYA